MIPAGEAAYLRPEDPVVGVALGGEARAYPLRILMWHENANDVVGAVPRSGRLRGGLNGSAVP